MTLPILNLLDIITTLYALNLGAVEINPLLAPVVSNPILFTAVKLSILPLCWWLRDKQSYPLVTAVYGVVVFNNLYCIYLLR